MTAPQILGIAALAALVAGTGGFWFSRSNQVADAYAAAAIDCAAGRGDAALRVLDQLHGEDARPKALRVQLSLCALDGSVDRYKASERALNP